MTDHISASERAFDFWVGEWDVHRSDTGELVGRNVITLLHGDGDVRRERDGAERTNLVDSARRRKCSATLAAVQ